LELFNGLSEHARLTLKSLNIIEDALRSGDLVRIKEAEVEVGVIENQVMR